MKLAPRTFRIQWDLHAWASIVASLFLVVVFYCGIFALFREELQVWQDPALHVAPSHEGTSFNAALQRVKEHGAIPRGARVGFSPHEGSRFVTAYWGELGTETLLIDSVTGTTLPERSRLGNELYQMHFFYRMPGGFELSGVLAVALLVALVTGLVIHLKDLPKQYWQFRPSLRLRFSSSDAHKVLGAFGLPFTVVLAWSGAVLCLSGLVGQGLAGSVFNGHPERVAELRGEAGPARTATNRSAAMLPLDELVARARAVVPGATGAPRFVDLQLCDDEAAWARVFFRSGPLGGDRYAFIDAVSGSVLATSATPGPSVVFERVLSDLHFARYGGLLLKVLYALLALAACAVVITGNVIWLERRDPQRERVGNRILERLTVGVPAGIVLASAVYFAMNRALPWGLAHRADWEFGSFLGVWAVAVGAALLPLWSTRQLGVAMGAGATALLVGVVTADIAWVDANLFTAMRRGLPAVFVTEALLVALALFCGGAAWGMSRPARKPADDPGAQSNPVESDAGEHMRVP